MRKFIGLLILCVLIFALVGCSIDETKNEDINNSTDGADSVIPESFNSTHQVEIEVENYGRVVVGLDENSAPITVKNFIELAEKGFYDGLTFHRIISGFMIQGGDPLGNGTGGSDLKIKGEFLDNGVENPLSHTRGAISMARSSDFNSASSQFFIVHQDSLFLDGQYAAFGYVTEGMDIVDQICLDTPVIDKNGTVKPENQPVIKSIKVIE